MKKLLLIIFIHLITLSFAQSQYWQRVQNIPAPYNNNYWLDIYFIPGNSNYGWICGFNGMVVRTTDGGNSWSGDTVPGAYHLESIHFPSTSIGYTSGVDGIWKSTNGGASWFSVKPVQAGDSISFWGCYFYDDNNGVVVGEGCGGSRQYFWRTTNGGTSWTYTNGNIFDSGLTDAIVLSTGRGIASSSGRIWTSNDGGFNWSVSATTGTNLWQEEIATFGQSILVPYAGDNCQGGGANGGMRFSTDNGTSWTDINVATPIFGAFLLNDTEGWACGYSREIYHTTDAGVTWTRKNCGIIPGNLDDIWFISSNVGWVVGQGVYKYSNAFQTISKTLVDFNDGCLGVPRFDTLWIANFNFNPAAATWQLSGPDAGDFRIITPNSNFNLTACDSTRMIIQFAPTTGGIKTATLRIDVPGYTVLMAGLTGTAVKSTTTLSDTLIVVDSADCGKTTSRTVTWKAEKSDEYVNSFSRVGSPDVSMVSAIPFLLNKTGVDTKFNINPSDTGWQMARFSFRLFPCNKDTFVTVKFYGYSPIINSMKKVDFQGECVTFKQMEIPVYNTGNNNLIISNHQILAPTNGFTIVGWKSGNLQPRTIPPGQSDTLMVRFQPAIPGIYSAKLRLTNNDLTKARGNANPYDIDLAGSLIYANVQTIDTLIDLGEICLGDSSSEKIKIWNSGNMSATFNQVKHSLSEFIFDPINAVYPIQVKQFDTIFANIRFKPVKQGLHTDTFLISTYPCDKQIRIIVKGVAVVSNVAINPNKLSGTVYNYSNTQANCRLTNLSSDEITVNLFNLLPQKNNWNVTINPTLPIKIAAGSYIDFVLTFSTKQDSTLITKICFDITSQCPVNVCTDAEIKSINDALEITPAPLDFGEVLCNPNQKVRKLKIRNLSNQPTRIDSLFILPQISGFTILNIPALPVYIPALDSIEVEIAFNPSNEGIYNAQISAVTPLSKVTADLSASFRKTILSLSESIHSFGKFEYCNLPLNKTFTIYNKGMLGDTVAVLLSKNNTGYSVDKSRVVLNANDSAEITATFNPQIARLGLNYGSITLSSATCKNTFEIELAAELNEPDLSITPISLSYNNVWFGDTLVRQITVTNTSDLPVTITKQSITTNAKRYLLDLLLPQDLQPKSSISFKIALIAELSGSFKDTLYFEYRSSCNYDSLISMISYVPDEVYSINLLVPDYIELPYQDIALDVSLTESVYKFRPDSIHFELAFDPWLFNPTSVHYKSDLGYIELSSDILPGGTISIKVPNVFADTLFLTKGTKFRILGKTFPSSPNKTPLDLRGINLFSNKRIDIKDDDGTLEISPVCHPTAGQHLILSGIISLLIKNEVVTDRLLELEINSTSKTFSFLSIYSVTGNKLINIKLSLEKGLNREALELNEIPNGIYYIYLMAASGQIISRKFIILN